MNLRNLLATGAVASAFVFGLGLHPVVDTAPGTGAVTLTLAHQTAGAQSAASPYRLEVGGGYSFSLFKEDVSEPVEGTFLTATLTEIETGSGPTASAAFWVDGLVRDNFSLGFEYNYSGFSPEATVRFSTRRRNRDVTQEIDATLHNGFINAAYRQNDGDLHPYAGLGIGLGYAKLDLDGIVANGEVGTVTGGLQGFIGIDYDVTEQFYIGANSRLYYIDGRLIGTDLQFLELQLIGKVGVRF